MASGKSEGGIVAKISTVEKQDGERARERRGPGAVKAARVWSISKGKHGSIFELGHHVTGTDESSQSGKK